MSKFGDTVDVVYGAVGCKITIMKSEVELGDRFIGWINGCSHIYQND
jgi:hypothetical protein